jgi:hypothetical protein
MRFAPAILALGCTVLTAACARPTVTQTASDVTLTDTPMSGDCERLGAVHGESGGAAGIYLADEKLLEYALNDLRNNASAMGATHVHAGEPTLGELDGVTNRGFAEGVAYRCGPGGRSVTDSVAMAVRESLDARATAILACTGQGQVAVRVEYAPEPPLRIGLQGDLAGSPEEQCVISVLGDLHVNAEGSTGTVIHLVQPGAAPPPPAPKLRAPIPSETTPPEDAGLDHDAGPDRDAGMPR